ncbi:MAG: hypothetical protein P1V18_00730 [Candidatus Gracilibacteria bacterium]|nr:hypothetical protein [Candidatus Gracilibacteria bacterium]
MSDKIPHFETQEISSIDGITLRLPTPEHFTYLSEECREQLLNCLRNAYKVMTGHSVPKKQLSASYSLGSLRIPSPVRFQSVLSKPTNTPDTLILFRERLEEVLICLENIEGVDIELGEDSALSAEHIEQIVKEKASDINSKRAPLEIPFVTAEERELLKNGQMVPVVPDWYNKTTESLKKKSAMQSLVPPTDDAEASFLPIIKKFKGEHPSKYGNMIALLEDEIKEWKLAKDGLAGSHTQQVLRILEAKKTEWNDIKNALEEEQRDKVQRRRKQQVPVRKGASLNSSGLFNALQTNQEIATGIIQTILSYQHPKGSSKNEIILNQITSLDMKITTFQRHLKCDENEKMKKRLKDIIEILQNRVKLWRHNTQGM